MKQSWICWTVFVLIVGSVLYELVTKTAQVRGIGAYPRKETPWAYWLVLLAKGVLATLIAGIALSFST